MITYRRLYDKSQTGAAMSRMVNRFSGDLDNFHIGNTPLSQIPLPTFYNIVKSLPYKKDTHGVEIITRPLHLLTSPFKGYDCKKKAVLVAAWLKENNIPYQFIAVSSRTDGRLHHVLIRAKINGQWLTIDPTYKSNKLYEDENWTAAETLSGFTAGQSPVLVELYGNGNTLTETANEFFYYRQNYLNDPECLGVVWTASGIAGVITAIVAGVTGMTIAIVQAVQNRKSEQRALISQREQQAFQMEAIKTQQEFQAEQEGKQEGNLLKYGLIGGGALALIYFLT